LNEILPCCPIQEFAYLDFEKTKTYFNFFLKNRIGDNIDSEENIDSADNIDSDTTRWLEMSSSSG
jgi:hypothetical protein